MLHPIVIAGIDDLAPVIIFLVIIIGRAIVEAGKKVAPPGKGEKPAPEGGGQRKTAGQDLEDFFKSLTGQGNAAPPANPPPVAQPVRQAQQRRVAQRRSTATPPPPPAVARRATAQPSSASRALNRREALLHATPLRRASRPNTLPRPSSRPAPSFGLGSGMLGGGKTTRGAGATSRADIVAVIRDERSIKKAIVLREILGPPVSLQNMSAQPGTPLQCR